ncbi:transglutaminase family protein [Spirosoma koreense]
MAIRIQLTHQTRYQYDRAVFLSSQLIRLKPAAHSQVSIESYALTIRPDQHTLHWHQDPFGNYVARVDFSASVESMAIDVAMNLGIETVNPFDFLIDTYAESYPFTYSTSLQKELFLYTELTEPGPYQTQWIGQIKHQPKKNTIDFLIGLNQQVCQAITYRERWQPGVQSAEETLRRAIGSCRDSAWLLVQLLRKLGLAARFVSGYLIQLKETDVPAPLAVQADSVALHAWAEVYLPGAGWIGLDPTSGMLTAESHIPLACSPNPAGAAPVSGTTGPAETQLSYTSTLTRLA